MLRGIGFSGSNAYGAAVISGSAIDETMAGVPAGVCRTRRSFVGSMPVTEIFTGDHVIVSVSDPMEVAMGGAVRALISSAAVRDTCEVHRDLPDAGFAQVRERDRIRASLCGVSDALDGVHIEGHRGDVAKEAQPRSVRSQLTFSGALLPLTSKVSLPGPLTVSVSALPNLAQGP
jgi:hypothetical protein